MEKTTNQTVNNNLKGIDLAASFMRKPATVIIPQQEPQVKDSEPLPEPSEPPSVHELVTPTASHMKTPHITNTKKAPSYQAFTVICNKELVRKIKAIAAREGLRINAVVQAMYTEGISSYERTHGSVDSKQTRKSAKDVLFAT